jgi:hypothetical protein
MGIGVSIFTITLGAILNFAISQTAMKDPVDVHVIGLILMIVGGASLALQLLLLNRMDRQSSNNDRERLYNGDNPPPV